MAFVLLSHGLRARAGGLGRSLAVQHRRATGNGGGESCGVRPALRPPALFAAGPVELIAQGPDPLLGDCTVFGLGELRHGPCLVRIRTPVDHRVEVARPPGDDTDPVALWLTNS